MSKMIKLAMENGEGYIPETENKEVQMVREFFPDNADVSKDQEGNYFVKTILNDHQICEGGQFAELSLSIGGILTEPTEIKGELIQPYLVMIVNSFFINGVNLKPEDINFYLVNDKELDFNNQFIDCNLFKQDREAMIFSLDKENKKVIGLGINTGFAVAGYLHELGHLTREVGVDLDSDAFLNSSQNLLSLGDKLIENPYEKLTPSEIELHRMAMYEERRACLKALDILRNNKELFPNDPGLIKIKQTYLHTLKSYIYTHQLFSGQEVVDILNLDSDWHY